MKFDSIASETVLITPERQSCITHSDYQISDLKQRKHKSSFDVRFPDKHHFDLKMRNASWEPLDDVGLQDHKLEKAFRQSRSYAFLLLMAILNLAIVYSELFCYFLLILNHMWSANLLSLPYPLMVFLWGMLSVPRPTKTFWIFMITYTEVRFFGIFCTIYFL